MKTVCLICNYWHFPSEKSSSRYFQLANMLTESGYRVDVITSDFRHSTKSFREKKITNDSFSFNIELIHEPGYQKNISIKRLISARLFAKNVCRFLRKTDRKYDLIFCSVPTLSLGSKTLKESRKKRIPFAIDLQDLWPDAFKMAFHVPVLSSVVFFPFKQKAKFIYKNADGLSAVSQTYLNYMLSIRGSNNCPTSFAYLGNDFSAEKIEVLKKQAKNNNNYFTIGYAGSLGKSYDLETVIKAISILQEEGINNIRFFIMGDGDKREKLEDMAKTLNVKCLFFGQLRFDDMMIKLLESDVTVNCINKNSVASIINKVGDYALAGKPTINTLKSKEYADLLESFGAGLNVEPDNPEAMAGAIKYYYNMSNEQLKQIGENHYLIEKLYFDRNKTYKDIIKMCDTLVEKQ